MSTTLDQSPRQRSLNRAWLLGLLLVTAVIFAYQPAWRAGFIWDDDDYVTHNPLLTAPDGLSRIWFSTDSPSQYFPLVYTTFRLEHALWGLNPAGYHWVNILLHAMNALLVWRLLLRLGIPGAWLAAAIFALHPVQVESVAWVTELKNVESLFFSLLALLAWVNVIEEQSRSSWRWYALAIVCYALALFSKTTACTLPAALLLILWLKKKPIGVARVARIIPFVVMGVAMGLVSMWWERHHQGTVGETYSMTWLERFLVASRALWFYLGKLLWPVNLTFNYPLWTIDRTDPLAYTWLAASAGLAAVIYFARRTVGRSLEVATLFFVATLSPLLGFVMLYTFCYTFVTDHYQYVALLGPVALAAAASTQLKGPWLRPALCGLVVAVLGVATWRQCRMYENLETLWRTTIARNPSSYMGHNNLGAIYLEQGRIDEAIARLEKSLSIRPHHANARYNLGRALLRADRVDEAIAQLQAVADADARDAKARSDLALALLVKGRTAEAIASARAAVELHPEYADAQNNLGASLLQQGQVDEAIVHFLRALALQPDLADAHYNLGTAYLHQSRWDEAIVSAQAALQFQPRFAKAHNNLATALFQKGRVNEAIAHFRTSLEIDPNNVEARKNLNFAQAARPGPWK